MTEPVIKVENLSKQYRIGSQTASYGSLRESLTNAFSTTINRLKSRKSSNSRETIWALKDVSFEVKQGEVVGIIGRNGAGKSTLLKILSRITKPTEGSVRLRGRVGSLLEVGTGFHPELTGRENIYLNGAILGMHRVEIERKFDEIVEFSEIEQFLDTPVKRYSSGMYVRLAFAVAAHLEPEILLVDEVLAVGDLAFQKKCLGKMGAVAQGGRTVLFVSHNMGAVKNLCNTGVLINRGEIAFLGDVSHCIDEYLGTNRVINNLPEVIIPENQAKEIQLLAARVINQEYSLIDNHPYDKPFYIEIEYCLRSNLSGIYLALHIHDRNMDTLLFSRDFESDEGKLLARNTGIHKERIKIPGFLLVPGRYSISVHIANSSPARVIDGIDGTCLFEVVDTASVRSKMGFPWQGKIATPLIWETIK